MFVRVPKLKTEIQTRINLAILLFQNLKFGENVKAMWLKQKFVVLGESFRKDVSNLLRKDRIRLGNFNWPNLLHGVDAQKYPITVAFACIADVLY